MSLLDTASLIVTPNGYKEGKLYSVIPSDGSGDMSVVRATTATRVNSAGLVELVPYNLIGYSEDFTNASWLKGASTITGNTTTAPNGTLTADTFSGNGASDLHIVLWQTDVIGVGNTISVYAKKNTNDFLQIYTDFVNTDFANFNLANGTTGSVGSSVISSSIESVGNGWYRCSFVVGSASSKYVNFCLVTSSTAGRAETNSLSASVFLWGAQLNEGTIKPYQKTETRLNIPRLDYSNGTCPSLLVEPQRTNLLTYSSSFDNSDWGKIGITAFANNTTAPNGTMSADKIAFTNTNSYIYPTAVVSAITNNSFSYSVYAKADTQSAFNMLIGTPVGVWGANFDLTTQTATPFSGSGTSGKIESVDNGWFRCILTAPIPVVVYAEASIGFPIAGGSLFFWGAQIEAGAYPTSYIPTTSASVTRNADVISKTGISSLIGQTEGTIFFDGYFGNNSDEVYLFLQSTGSTSIDNSIYLVKVGVGISLKVFVGSTSQVSIQGGSFTLGQRIKIAAAYKQNDFILYVNGTQIGTDVLGNVPTCSNLHLGTYAGDPTNQIYIANKGINSAILFPTRLTNTQLAQLTTI
jgi:hypothetical protein